MYIMKCATKNINIFRQKGLYLDYDNSTPKQVCETKVMP